MSDTPPRVVVIGRNYWGGGADVAEAKRNMRAQGGRLAYGYTVLTFGDGSTFVGVNRTDGSVQYEGTEPTVETTQVKGKAAAIEAIEVRRKR